MSKCLILCKLKPSTEKHTIGMWVLVDKSEEEQTIKTLGEAFLFSFDLDEQKDEPLLSQL